MHDERPRYPRRPRSVDASPTKREVAREWGPRPRPLSLAEKQARAAQSAPEPEAEPVELSEGEKQKIKRAVRDLRGD